MMGCKLPSFVLYRRAGWAEVLNHELGEAWVIDCVVFRSRAASLMSLAPRVGGPRKYLPGSPPLGPEAVIRGGRSYRQTGKDVPAVWSGAHATASNARQADRCQHQSKATGMTRPMGKTPPSNDDDDDETEINMTIAI